MPENEAFSWALIRVVSRVERGETLNVGVIVFCRRLRFLQARLALDPQRLATLAPGLDYDAVREQLALFPRICAGDADIGPWREWNQSERFLWLTAPRSTIVQTSPTHCGLCQDPQAVLDDLFERLVA